MKFCFPEVKSFLGLGKIYEELKEFKGATNADNAKEELIDIYHCVEVLLRRTFKDSAEIEKYIQRVKEKNKKKGSYK